MGSSARQGFRTPTRTGLSEDVPIVFGIVDESKLKSVQKQPTEAGIDIKNGSDLFAIQWKIKGNYSAV